MSDSVYSRRLGAITPEQFQAALSHFHLGSYVRAEPVAAGLFGQNVYLTSSRGQYILRGAPHYPWQFPTEAFFTNQLHTKTRVPVAHPYLYEPDVDIFGWSFAIMPRLPGISVKDPAVRQDLTGEDRAEQARELARTLVEAQKLTWDISGKYQITTGKVEPLDCGYREWVVENIRQKLIDSLTYNDHTTAADARWIEEIIAEAQPAFQFPFRRSIVFGDYGEHNVLFQREDGPETDQRWRISAVIDLMTAHFGDGQADLSLPVAFYLKEDPELADIFIGEYLRRFPAQPEFRPLQKLYMVDLLLSFWRYWQRETGRMPEDEQGRLTFRAYAEASVRYWDLSA